MSSRMASATTSKWRRVSAAELAISSRKLLRRESQEASTYRRVSAADATISPCSPCSPVRSLVIALRNSALSTLVRSTRFSSVRSPVIALRNSNLSTLVRSSRSNRRSIARFSSEMVMRLRGRRIIASSRLRRWCHGAADQNSLNADDSLRLSEKMCRFSDRAREAAGEKRRLTHEDRR